MTQIEVYVPIELEPLHREMLNNMIPLSLEENTNKQCETSIEVMFYGSTIKLTLPEELMSKELKILLGLEKE